MTKVLLTLVDITNIMIIIYNNKNLMLLLLWLGCLQPAAALTFKLKPGSDIIGSIQTANVVKGESLAEIGRKFDVGIYEMIESNPELNTWRPVTNSTVVIPTQYILPPGQRKGMVINLAEMRIYYYHTRGNLVTTHPIGIGRKDWETPLGKGRIISKTKDPSWRPPKSIRAWYDKRGKYLPDIVPPGPRNPLGKYAIRLSIPGYLIHGTNRPGGIGVRSSSGCIRMYPEDIESIFYKVDNGTPVRIVHNPYKIGRHNNRTYIEAHEPLSDPYYQAQSNSDMLAQAVAEAPMAREINHERAFRALKSAKGYPILID